MAMGRDGAVDGAATASTVAAGDAVGADSPGAGEDASSASDPAAVGSGTGSPVASASATASISSLEMTTDGASSNHGSPSSSTMGAVAVPTLTGVKMSPDDGMDSQPTIRSAIQAWRIGPPIQRRVTLTHETGYGSRLTPEHP